MSLKRVLRVAAAGVVLSAITLDGFAASSSASVLHDTVVSDNPSDITPHLVADTTVARPHVDAFAQSSGTMYAGGVFNTVTDASRSQTYLRTNLVSFDAVTGALTSFAPAIDGRVHALAATSDALYVGGTFATVDGIPRRALVKIDSATGTVNTAFDAHLLSGKVNDLQLVDNRLFVAGTAGKKLMALDPITGNNTGYVNLEIGGRLEGSNGGTSITKFSVNVQGTQLAAVGNFTTVAGRIRHRAFLADLGSTTATLDPWYYNALTRPCSATVAARQAYLTDVDFSPDGTYFVVVATGYIPRPGDLGQTVCDAAARFDVDIATPDRPVWLNYTGGDTIYSVAVTGAAVYVQGHFDYLDNPDGTNTAGPGAVVRRGVGAINPVSGVALDWNPDAPAKIGGYGLYATPQGIWFGADSQRFGAEYHRGIAFTPLQ